MNIIIPVKSLKDGKSRLSQILSAEERCQLNTRLLEKTLGAASGYVNTESVTVASHCLETLKYARGMGVETIHSKEGLNLAVQEATSHVIKKYAGSILVLACDLPYISSEDLNIFHSGVTVATDCAYRGTNAIFFEKGQIISFKFGENSLNLHAIETKKAGLRLTVLQHRNISFDLDTLDDYRHFLAGGRAPLKFGT